MLKILKYQMSNFNYSSVKKKKKKKEKEEKKRIIIIIIQVKKQKKVLNDILFLQPRFIQIIIFRHILISKKFIK